MPLAVASKFQNSPFTAHEHLKRTRPKPRAAEEASSPLEAHRPLKARETTSMCCSEGPGLSFFFFWHSFWFLKKLQSKPVSVWSVFYGEARFFLWEYNPGGFRHA